MKSQIRSNYVHTSKSLKKFPRKKDNMKFDFSEANFEKGRIHFREGQEKHSRARILFQNGDWAGTVEASQHAVEFYIKTLYVFSGNKIPKSHDPAITIDPLFNELKRINPDLFKNALIDPYERLKKVSSDMKSLHETAMYGEKGKPASKLYSMTDAIKYYEIAQEILLLTLLIVFQFGYYHELLPSDGREFLDSISPGFYKKKT